MEGKQRVGVECHVPRHPGILIAYSPAVKRSLIAGRERLIPTCQYQRSNPYLEDWLIWGKAWALCAGLCLIARHECAMGGLIHVYILARGGMHRALLMFGVKMYVWCPALGTQMAQI